MSYMKRIKVSRIEERPSDTWYDMSLRQLRNGQVNYYRARDFLTGEWLFKLCRDQELGKVLVRAVKCPPGARFAQLEGNSMVFQHSQREGWLYDVVSLTQADENDKLSRKVVDALELVPPIIRENYEVKPYEEATGKPAPGKHWVTLSRADDEKAMVALFLLERAWTLSTTTPEEKIKTLEEQEQLTPKPQKIEIDTGQTWMCPICGDEFRLKHVEKETAVKHSLKKSAATAKAAKNNSAF
jgi:hypothetical protein